MSESTECIVSNDDQAAEKPQWIELEGGISIRASEAPEEHVIVGEYWIPEVIEVLQHGAGEPEVYARIETGDGESRLTELHITAADPDSQGIRQGHLRDIDVSTLVVDFVALYTARVENAGTDQVMVSMATTNAVFEENRRVIDGLRARKTSRAITPLMLSEVARIYRENISGYPTKAVQDHFKVSQRTAAGYVSRARAGGFLPPTVRGKKQA